MPIRGACPLTGIGRVKWNTLPTHLLKSFILFHLVVDTLLLPVPGPRLSSTLVLEEQMKLEGSCVPRISMWGGSRARSRPLQTGTGMSGGHCWPLTAKRWKVEKPQVMTLLLEHSLVVDLGFSYDKILVFPLPWWRERIIRQVAFILLRFGNPVKVFKWVGILGLPYCPELPNNGFVHTFWWRTGDERSLRS